MVKNLPASAGDEGSIPGSGRSNGPKSLEGYSSRDLQLSTHTQTVTGFGELIL